MTLRTISRFAALAACAALLLVPSAAGAASKPSYQQLKQQVKQLKHSRAVWLQRADLYEAQRNRALTDLADAKRNAKAAGDAFAVERATMSGKVNDLTSQVGVLQGSVATLTQQRDQALAGLPAAIAAVPIADFGRLVFAPARAAWPCDSFYQSGSFWSYSFDSPGC